MSKKKQKKTQEEMKKTYGIYAKPIKNAESTYTLSKEEKEAISKAIETKN